MNLGAWTLTAYSATLTLLAADQLMNGGPLLPVRRGVSIGIELISKPDSE